MVCTEPGYEFDKSSLLKYNHMSFGGPPVKTETSEEEDELVRHDENESKIGTFFLFYCKISSPSSALLILLKIFSQGDFFF